MKVLRGGGRERQPKSHLKLILLSLLASSLFFLTACGNRSTDGTFVGTTDVKVVDGYVKNALVKDAIGNIATYQSNGTYRFNKENPTYPLTASGGQLEDTNSTFDINLTAQSGSSVISPITTFLQTDFALLNKMATALSMGADINNFEIDYVNTNDTTLSKISQLLYIVLKDDTLKTAFTARLNAANPITPQDIFALFEIDINASNFAGKRKMRYLLNKINDYAGSASGMESYIKNFKNSLIASAVDGNRTIVKTGQTTAGYDNGGASGTGTKDDGYYKSGVARSYTDNGQTVTDNATELIWQKEDDNTTRNWSDAETYCAGITLDGNSSFRLPTVEELSQLADFGRSSPSINPIFTNTNSDYYWSSTTNLANPTNALIVRFWRGRDNVGNKTTTFYVRCVR